MSRTSYQIEYKDSEINIKQIFSVMMEIAKEIDNARKTSLSMLEWIKNADNEKEPFIINTPIFEVKLPKEFTKDINVFEEVIRVAPIDDKSMQIVITDASLSQNKCEDIAINFAKQLYEKATGKKIKKEQILVKRIASLAENICEHCLQKIESFPYACKICGRTFCYDHRRPETHGCQLGRKISQSESSIMFRSIPRKKSVQPKVIVKRIPCG